MRLVLLVDINAFISSLVCAFKESHINDQMKTNFYGSDLHKVSTFADNR